LPLSIYPHEKSQLSNPKTYDSLNSHNIHQRYVCQIISQLLMKSSDDITHFDESLPGKSKITFTHHWIDPCDWNEMIIVE
jgi:hypothetical protein